VPPLGFEPEIPASEQPQTHALDRTSNRIGLQEYNITPFDNCIFHMLLWCLKTREYIIEVYQKGYQWCASLKMEVACSSGMLICTHHITWYHIPEDLSMVLCSIVWSNQGTF